MSKELVIVWACRHQRVAWDSLCETYRRRLEEQRITVRDRPIRAKGSAADPRRLQREGEALVAALPSSSWVVALDRRGDMPSSVEFARQMDRLLQEWAHPVAFVIGSDLGLDRNVVSQARERLSLGRMTFPHELARLVLYEQLYRAVAIERGINYHRQPLT